MFKNKERRDTLLLIFMGVVFVGFLIYIFLPQKKIPANNHKNTTQVKKNNNSVIINNKKNNKIRQSNANLVLNEEEELIRTVNDKLKKELKELFTLLQQSRIFFQTFKTQKLTQTLDEFYNKIKNTSLKEQIKKIQSISFFELSEYFFGNFSNEKNKDFKFNLYLAYFLSKISPDNILPGIISLPENKIIPLLNLEFYQLLNYEVLENYQLFPILFYYYILVEKADIFSLGDMCSRVNTELKKIMDLTPGKYLLKVREILEFYQESEGFRIEWVEEDGMSSDDKGIYKNQAMEIITFLNQKYIIFNRLKKSKKDQWINELCEADQGDIELIELKMVNESPSKGQKVQKIFYAPNTSMFIVILEQKFLNDKDMLSAVIHDKMNRYFSNYKKIEFTFKDTKIDKFRNDLSAFGNYLKYVYNQ